jgi:hypothetical protein
VQSVKQLWTFAAIVAASFITLVALILGLSVLLR